MTEEGKLSTLAAHVGLSVEPEKEPIRDHGKENERRICVCFS